MIQYVGLRVNHRAKFGEGVVVSQDESGHIGVKFNSETEVKTFSAPACFRTFLTLEDSDAAKQVDDARQSWERAKAAENAQRQRESMAHVMERRLRSAPYDSKSRSVSLHTFSSPAAFFDAQEHALLAQAAYLRKTGGKRQRITDGKLVERKSNRYIYSFESESELNLPDNTQISLWPSGAIESIPGVVIDCEDFTLIIAMERFMGETIPSIEFSSEPWRLYSFLVDRLKEMRANNSPIAEAIICEGRRKIEPKKEVVRGQVHALEMSLCQPITFIWGPPGTGKTETLANIVLAHVKNRSRVLMLSYSNVSVDGAILRVISKDDAAVPGKYVRYGYPKNRELLQHDYLTSYNFALYNDAELLKQRQALAEERKHCPRTSKRYVDIGTELTAIKRKLQEAERQAVSRALFVATTISKALADKLIYDSQFDTVIVDEASMAYVPQIVFAASLAKSHFVCMGDFAQLPPIVQGDNTSLLNADIFQYCGITDAVQMGYGHEWLCMLDVQYRMHPEIAALPGKIMYHGLLRSAPEMLQKRQPIAKSSPAPGIPLALVDLSGMMSVCTKTADQSRINVLSAMITMGLAMKAAQTYDVGIITPYNAQSRLLHAMSRDVSERYPKLHSITCATVHQFQGSEKDVIFYDAVDCYRMQYPGQLLASNANNTANRLFNVAMTRARGKMLSVVNVDYMLAKRLSRDLLFRRMIDELRSRRRELISNAILREMNGGGMIAAIDHKGDSAFITDLSNAKNEIRIDIPGGVTGKAEWYQRLTELLEAARKKGIKVIVRAASKNNLPSVLRPLSIENPYIANPVAILDNTITWFGIPASTDSFKAEGTTIETKVRPVLRFEGKRFAQALYGFLEMHNTVDSVRPNQAKNEEGSYDTFAAYIGGEVRCSMCGSPMQLKKSKKGKFFVACTAYPSCENTRFVDADLVEDYLWFNNRKGHLCPQDGTSLEAAVGPYGVYVHCNGIRKHTFRLDEI